MSYSIAKLVEFALSYILNNELLTKKYDMTDDTRQVIIKFIDKRIHEIRNEYK